MLVPLHFLGPQIMGALKSSHHLVKVLFFIALVAIVEFGIWVSATGFSNFIERLQKEPKETLQDMKASFLKLGLIHILMLIFLLSVLLTR